jgi:hypothetical protein
VKKTEQSQFLQAFSLRLVWGDRAMGNSPALVLVRPGVSGSPAVIPSQRN